MSDCVQGHVAMIYDRGGVTRLWTLVNLQKITWGRVREAKSQAVVTITGKYCEDQLDIIDSIQSRRHELVIFRGADRVWEGPIIQVDTYSGYAVITANDVKEYLDGTSLSQDWPGPDDGDTALMTDRVSAILNYELTTSYDMVVGTEASPSTITVERWEELDPPANILPYVTIRDSTTLFTRSSTMAFEMMVGEHLDNLAQSGLAYTAIGRMLFFWDEAQTIGQTRTVTETDFSGDLRVIQSGTEFGAITHISASRGEDDSTTGVGHAGDVDPYYGAWERIVSVNNEDGTDDPTQFELNSQARRDLVGRNPVPLELRVPDGASMLLRTDDLTINQLIPGVVIPVRAQFNLRQLSQDQRLDKVSVTEDGSGEQIQVTMIPAGDLVDGSDP